MAETVKDTKGGLGVNVLRRRKKTRRKRRERSRERGG